MVGVIMCHRDTATGHVACAAAFYAEVADYASAWFSPEHA